MTVTLDLTPYFTGNEFMQNRHPPVHLSEMSLLRLIENGAVDEHGGIFCRTESGQVEAVPMEEITEMYHHLTGKAEPSPRLTYPTGATGRLTATPDHRSGSDDRDTGETRTDGDVCHHEAGHTLGALACGIPVARTWVDLKTKSGRSVINSDFDRLSREESRRHLVWVWSGGWAEALHLEGGPCKHVDMGRDCACGDPHGCLSEGDKSQIRRLARGPLDTDPLHCAQSYAARREARDILADGWDYITALAALLERRGEVSGEECERLFTEMGFYTSAMYPHVRRHDQ